MEDSLSTALSHARNVELCKKKISDAKFNCPGNLIREIALNRDSAKIHDNYNYADQNETHVTQIQLQRQRNNFLLTCSGEGILIFDQ